RSFCSFFFFQAEDGIRDFHVTGVQTCALPIFGDLDKIGMLEHSYEWFNNEDAMAEYYDSVKAYYESGIDQAAAGTDPENAQVFRSEEHTSELQSRENLVCRLLLEKKKINRNIT